jgi:heptosyltransferase-3
MTLPVRTRGNPTLRFLDRYAGIPLVLALGALPRRKFDATSVRRIGLMKTVAIGDTILFSGIAADVKQRYPHATVVVVSGDDNRAAAELFAVADEHVRISARRPLATVAALRRARLDVLIDFGNWTRFDALVTGLSGARFRVGFDSPGQARKHAYDAAVPYASDVHEIENFRSLAATIGVQSTSAPAIRRPETLDTRRFTRGYVAFHPWAGGFRREIKQWPQAMWMELGTRVAARGWDVVLTGGPSDREQSATLAAALGAASVTVHDLAGRLSVGESADLFAGSVATVSVNTGAMHLAAAAGARTVSLEGPTSARRWGPVGPHVRSVESTLSGCGYLNLGWEYAGRRDDCMTGVPVPRVMEAIDELLAERA